MKFLKQGYWILFLLSFCCSAQANTDVKLEIKPSITNDNMQHDGLIGLKPQTKNIMKNTIRSKLTKSHALLLSRLLIIIILIGLGGGLGWHAHDWWKNRNNSSRITPLETENSTTNTSNGPSTNELEQANENLRSEIENLRGQLDKQSSENTTNSPDTTELQEEIARLKSEIEELNCQLKAAAEFNSEVGLEFDTQGIKVNSIWKDSSQLEEKNKKLCKEFRGLQKENAKLCAENEKLHTAYNKLVRDYNTLCKTNENLESENTELGKRYNECYTSNQNLTRENQTLKLQVKDLRAPVMSMVH